MTDHYHSSFPPIITEETETLILGSLPGAESLRRQQYYAHPRNRFWRIIASLAERNYTEDYKLRIEMLTVLRLGLWDVAARAIRPGSLDSDITGETPNDVPLLLKGHPNIKTVIFNGRKAQALYQKYFTGTEGIRYIYLPSTSPANAGFSFDRLLSAWRSAVMK